MNPGRRAASVVGLVGGAVSLVGLALAAAIVFHDFQAKIIRCYALDGSVAHSEQRLLDGLAYDCSSQVCRLVLKFDRRHGLACYVDSTPNQGLDGYEQGLLAAISARYCGLVKPYRDGC
jgi:hypothetical protein